MSFSIVDCVVDPAAVAHRRAPRAPRGPRGPRWGGDVDPGEDFAPAVGGGVRAPELPVEAVLGGLKTDTGPCVDGGEACASAPVVALMREFATREGQGARAPARAPAPAEDAEADGAGEGAEGAAGAAGEGAGEGAEGDGGPAQAAQAVAEAAARVGCPSDDGGACVLRARPFQRFAAERGVSTRALAAELETRYKAVGPRDTRAQLSNFNIDDTLRRWAATSFPDFYPCPFAMMDFDDTREEFAVVDLVGVLEGREAADLGPALGRVARPSKTFACVVNTDYSTGPGKHWVAVFVDCRGPGPWTVEYFNSTGRPPPRPMVAWLERTRARLAAHRGPPGAAVEVVTDVNHQEGRTECGIYSLFYIRRRLEGTPIDFFRGMRIADDAMTAFRPHVFRRQ